eukprot:gene7282-9924_t
MFLTNSLRSSTKFASQVTFTFSKIYKHNDAAAGLQVVFIRHGEKPTIEDNYGPNSPIGDEYIGLSPKGWLRAQDLPVKIIPMLKEVESRNISIFAMKQKVNKKGVASSRRPLETVLYLADKLSLGINTDFEKEDYGVVTDKKEGILSGLYAGQSVIVCWEHNDLVKVIEAFDIPKNKADIEWSGATAYSKVVILNYDNDGKPETLEIRDQDNSSIHDVIQLTK